MLYYLNFLQKLKNFAGFEKWKTVPVKPFS